MDSNVTVFRGRRCVRVKRQTGAGSPASQNTPAGSNTNSTSKATTPSTSPSSPTLSGPATTNPDVPSSVTPAADTNPPVPIPPPPPPEAETNPQSTPTTVRNGNAPPAGGSPAPGPTSPPAPATPKSPSTVEPAVPNPGSQPSVPSGQSSAQPSQPTTPDKGSDSNAPPTPIAPPPPESTSPTASVPVAVAPSSPNASPQGGGQAPSTGGQSPAPGGSGAGAAPQPQPDVASSQQGGNNQNTPPAVAGGSSAANNPPNPGSPQTQPNTGGSGSSPNTQSPSQAGGSSDSNPTEPGEVTIPAAMTSGGTGKPSVVVTTGKGGSLTSYTVTPTPGTSIPGGRGKGSGSALSTHNPNLPHADGSTHSPGEMDAGQGKRVDVGAIGGAIAAVFGVALIAFLIIFCGKRARRRKRSSGTPLLTSAGGRRSMKERVKALVGTARSPSPAATPIAGERRSLREKVTSVLSGRTLFGGDQDAAPVARSTTPALERGMRDISTSDAPQNRASSDPPQTFGERALGPLAMIGRQSPSRNRTERQPQANHKAPRLPTPVAQHRRSSSSVPSIIQSWTATDEENNPFRDPDPARPLRLLNPDLSRSNTTNTIGTARQPLAPASMLTDVRPNPYPAPVAMNSSPFFGPPPSRPQHKRSFSKTRIPNPFLDPEPQPDESNSRSPPQRGYTASGHSRTTSLRQDQFERSTGTLMHQNSTSTIDSGFVSATVSPELQQEGFARRKDKASNREDSEATPHGLSTIPASRSASGSSQGASSISPSELLRELEAFESPFADFYRSSNSISRDFGPESMASESVYTRPTTSAFPSYILDENRRMSRASDPFDLDRPEILGLMKLGRTASRDTSLSRSTSNRSIRSERSGVRGKRKSQGLNHPLNSGSVQGQ
ncbi:hypothetical protein FKW77_008772 [Venturia effusa]|uniref:Uncharacterized protein n=1 Tax=Venturia effusa TaxID=50376 RepID=A0A517L7X3_9PEZI|nr:hypothetical protein FKW77_008772 [Venturia effusa]